QDGTAGARSLQRIHAQAEGRTYGSDEYKGSLEAMGEGLKHHYARHHPEHFPNGVNDMTLVVLVEMLADWKAATERHDDGNLRQSLEIQRERFGISDQLLAVLYNTAEHGGWLPSEKPDAVPVAHCDNLDDNGKPTAGRVGRHDPHLWFDVTSADQRWCEGQPMHPYRAGR
ncbi:DUF5662 family protein, partial [Actinoplanes sp. NPDC051633]|uniref:DUF5662 family protein n=1 Tax=Actinoplanes sp. NPDC051633 TaxID=3155670 RepID=UPI0034298E9F